MDPAEPRFSARSMVIAVIVPSILCCIIVLSTNSRRGEEVAPAAAVPGSISDNPTPITAIRLNAGVSPTRVREGEKIRIAALISVRGGSAPVTFSARIPRSDGGTNMGSVTTMVAQNATHGFDLPGFTCDLSPGHYTFSFRAFSGRVSSPTQTVTLVVEPAVFSVP